MQFLQQQWQGFASKRGAFFVLLLLAVLLHSAGSLVGQFYADDFIQRSMVVGSSALQQKGLLDGIDAGNFSSFIVNQFNFFSPENANFKAMMEFGTLPWWTGDGVSLRFFRPVAAATHFIDYTLWPDSPRIMHFINLLWYVTALGMIYWLYRRLLLTKKVALLALLLVILDASVYQIESWIASRSMLMVVAIGLFSVYAYHRAVTQKRWYVLALLSFIVCLFTAEAVIGICAFLGAYLFTLDNRPWAKRLLALLPFALLALVWHWAYQKAGFGAYGVDFYLDPGQQPKVFLAKALYRLPGNFFELASGLDFFSGQVRADIRQLVFAGAGLLLGLVLLGVLWPYLKTDKRLRFFFLASLFALVPSLSIALAPRTLFLPNIGFAVVLAYLFKAMSNNVIALWQRTLAKFLASYTLLVHVFLSFILAFWVMTVSPINKAFSQEASQRGYLQLGIDHFSHQHIVVVNALQPFWMIFMAYQWDYFHKPLPQSLRLLSTSFYPLTLTRVAENRLMLEASPGMQLDRHHLLPIKDKPAGHFIYLTWELLGLMRSETAPWQKGQCREFSDMKICVAALYQGKPQKLLIDLKKPLDSYRFVYQAMPSQAFKAFVLPPVGQSIKIKGLFGKP